MTWKQKEALALVIGVPMAFMITAMIMGMHSVFPSPIALAVAIFSAIAVPTVLFVILTIAVKTGGPNTP